MWYHRTNGNLGGRRRLDLRTTLTARILATACIWTGASLAWGQGTAMRLPRSIATWDRNTACVQRAVQEVQNGSPLITAVEEAIKLAEADIEDRSVGRGGIPNAAGVVQLDACIMDGVGHRAGSVAALEGILHPISVARRVMETTPHVMLVGDGARQFALQHGFEESELLTDEGRQAWEKWRTDQAAVESSAEQHDTIALLVVGPQQNVAGGCSTSGLGYKLPGRVGDSPILGGGLYVDNEVGAAGATGTGENVMRYCGTFMVVEAMRRGATPEEACVETVRTIIRKDPRPASELHINFIAIDRQGRVGGAGTDEHFTFVVADSEGVRTHRGVRCQ